MKERASVRGVLKEEKVGGGGEFAIDCRFKASNFKHKTVENELTRSLFSASVYTSYIGLVNMNRFARNMA